MTVSTDSDSDENILRDAMEIIKKKNRRKDKMISKLERRLKRRDVELRRVNQRVRELSEEKSAMCRAEFVSNQEIDTLKKTCFGVQNELEEIKKKKINIENENLQLAAELGKRTRTVQTLEEETGQLKMRIQKYSHLNKLIGDENETLKYANREDQKKILSLDDEKENLTERVTELENKIETSNGSFRDLQQEKESFRLSNIKSDEENLELRRENKRLSQTCDELENKFVVIDIECKMTLMAHCKYVNILHISHVFAFRNIKIRYK